MVIPFIPVIDHVNLVFHEGGHIVFGFFGNEFLTSAGGTLMQLLIPAMAFFYFLRKEEHFSSFLMLFWFGENFLGIGTYMGDALNLELPLIGGGLHDWTYMFGQMGVLPKCVAIGNFTIFLGFGIMAYALVNIIVLLNKKRIKKAV